jgi:enamine deaminase RidA (YjgF/YER057c/UK114 family)
VALVTVELIDPDGLYPPPTYSHVAVGRGSRVVFISGQVGFDQDRNLVGDDAVSQAEQAFRNVETAVQAVGGTLADIAKITIYVVGHRPELLEPLMAARESVFGEHKPASTYVGVEALARPGLLVEVEAVAVLD